MRLKIRRLLLYSISLVLIVGGAVYARIQTTLPYYDYLRFHHWVRGAAWTELADALWEETEFDFVFWDGSKVEASSDTELDVELSEAQAVRYRQLMSAADVGHLSKGSGGLHVSLYGTEKFGRDFIPLLVYRKVPRPELEECRAQYRNLEEGICGVRLDDNWVLEYGWVLPHEQHIAKCVGILRAEAATSGDAEQFFDGSRWYMELSTYDNRLSKSEVDNLAMIGAMQLRTARLTGDRSRAARLIEGCELGIIRAAHDDA